MVAIKELVKIGELKERAHSAWIFFKIEQDCAGNTDADLIASLPWAIAEQHGFRLSLLLSLE